MVDYLDYKDFDAYSKEYSMIHLTNTIIYISYRTKIHLINCIKRIYYCN